MEKGGSELELCGHANCGMGGRLEYCGVDAANPVVDAAIVFEALKSVLYEEDNNRRIKRDGYFDHHGGQTNAIFLETQPAEDPENYGDISTLIAASHSVDHEHSAEKFGLEVSWHVPENEMNIGWIATKYLVSLSPQGNITAMVTQADVATGEYNTERMTHYDWLQLAENVRLLGEDSDVLDNWNDRS